MPGTDLIQGDRRTNRRYAFEMRLSFIYQSGVERRVGNGYTKDLGRKGIRFVSNDPPPDRAEVEIRVNWPFLLQGICPLELRIWGRVLRNDDEGTVVGMTRYEFLTRGERSFGQVSAKAEGWSILA